VKDQLPKKPGLYKRFFAYMMARSSGTSDDAVGRRVGALLRDLHGDVLEIGAGTASNLALYAPDVRWLGVEPNQAMFQYARRQAERLDLQIDMRTGQSESLPVEDESMDAVVSTHVMCSVVDPEQTIDEILRVLKPGGRFVFLEHVAAPRGTRLRRIQGFIRPAWQVWGDGCQPDRETWAVIEDAGFSQIQMEHFKLEVPIFGPHIAGVAVKAGSYRGG
jgi:ubiquinone/menaquinone biosynthesis C-methylase UbiE